MKGFTLVELMIVIILLGLIALTTVPVIISNINDSKEKLYNEQVILLENATKRWTIYHTNEVEKTEDFSRCVTIEELEKENYIEDKKVINPKTNEYMNGCVEIKYDQEYNQFTYKYKEA